MAELEAAELADDDRRVNWTDPIPVKRPWMNAGKALVPAEACKVAAP